jgi:hypothetical protein
MDLVRSLGTAGAVANAGAPIAAREDEAAMVDALAGRVAPPGQPERSAAGGGVRAA